MVRARLGVGVIFVALLGLGGCGKEQPVEVKPQDGLERAKGILNDYANGAAMGSEAETFEEIVEEVRKTDPQKAPPIDQRVEITAPDDGDYLVEVQHLNFLVGPSEVYRLTVAPSEPGFDVTLGIDRYDVGAGGTLPLPLIVSRRGFTGPIEVRVVGGTGVRGAVTIPANQPPQPNLIGATLLLSVIPFVVALYAARGRAKSLKTSSSLIPSSLACSGICFSTNGVRTNPGQMTLARTPNSAFWMAIC